ncbi:efflux RND transporter periplasmic adaptor subunit [Flavobacterium crassostreae]|uniref:Efflux transporter periplasmic adaptor subunit n=1 Tax=Flavobacterium crassostreae TaxID=1763534 RepID=A0A1B9DXI7_9FLAO|nr:efflux RND transporter periplasmic adaptor subunit [Flavobacterium crassostreae]OCB74404.1 efflux transporter periplasmic adaptor subunit [Flavobacterium crassostreae]
MKKTLQISLLLIVLVLGVSCNTKNKQQPTATHSEENIFYTCSMDPQVKEDKPGKCPICQMDLTPMKKDTSALNEIRLSEQQIKLGNISLQKIAATQKSLDKKYTGVLAVHPEKIKNISARASGRIEKLYFKAQGDYISKNQAIYQLYSEEIAVAKQDYFVAYKQLSMPGDFGKNAKTLWYAAKQKLLFYGLTNAQIESITSAAAAASYTTFYSNYSGYVSEIFATQGSYIPEGAPITQLVDYSTLWLEIEANANYVSNVYLGQKAVVAFVDYPSKTIKAAISFINPEINPESRLLLIRIEIPNASLDLKPGMQAVATLYNTSSKAVFIPADALIRDQKATYVWVEKKHGVYQKIRVETGIESGGAVEIKTQLDPNKRVVITGAYAINSEYQFRKGADPMAGMQM